MEDTSFAEFYIIEADEHIEKIEALMLDLKNDPADAPKEELMRAAHSIKGSAAVLGFEVSSYAARIMEDMMEAFMNGHIPSKKQVEFSYELLSIIKDNKERIARGEEEDSSAIARIDARFNTLSEEAPTLVEQEKPEESEQETAEKEAGELVDKSSFAEYYLAEAEEYIEKIQHDLLILEKDLENTSTEELMRAAHSLKGSSSLLGFDISSHAAHILEDMMEMHGKGYCLTREHIDFCFDLLDIIKDNTERIAQGKEEDSSIVEQIDAHFNSISGKIGEAKQPAPSTKVKKEPEKAKPAPPPSAQHNDAPKEQYQQAVRVLKIKTDTLDEIMNIAGELKLKKDSLLNLYNGYVRLRDEIGHTFDNFTRLNRTMKDIFENTLPTVDLGASQRAFDSYLADFQDLEFDDYDESNILWKKLEESTADLEALAKELYNENYMLKEYIAQLEYYITALQANLVNARVIELNPIFMRFERAVRDISKQENKLVEFSASGGETKVDTGVLSIIVDPAVQILRNAVAHGIEPAEERKRAGKSEKGHISVSASKKGNDISIKIVDDGRGIDFDKVRKKSVKLGLYESEEKISDDECLGLIFSPGFSTAEKASYTAGRGVGLDIVQANLAKIGGKLKIETEKGKVTTFTLLIPMSLAMSSGISIVSGKVEFIIPVSYIQEVGAAFRKDIKQKENGEYTITFRGKNLQLYYLSDILDLPSSDSDEIYVIMVDLGTRQVVLAVDNILGHEEIFIKPMAEFLKGLKYYIGTALSSDGDIRLVLDVFSLFIEDSVYHEYRSEYHEETVYEPKVLVVDDALSIRRYLSDCISRLKCQVKTASNGMEALRILQEEEDIDLVVTDLEMPIMHGYELIERIKSTYGISDIPVVVLTSRSGGKYKNKAFELGANGYLHKPFKDEDLREVINKFTSYQLQQKG